jgi:DNA modification methylase
MEPLSPELNAGGMGTAPRLQVINRRIHELKMDPRNPRQHSQKQIKQMVLSIKTFGFLVPAVVDANGNVVTGHARILACRELGWSEIPTVLFDSLSEAKRRAYMLADNRLSEHSSWNERLLAEQLKDLVLGELDFSIEALGWDMPEIELKIASLDEQPAAEDRNDRVPEPVTTPPLSRPGDLWLLGGHRVLCGSALDITALEKLVGDERAAMVFTDPPYNVPIDGYVIGEMSAPASTVFLARSVRNHAAFCFSGSLVYVCMDWRYMEELLSAGRDADLELQNLCVWAKDNGGIGSPYRSQHQLVFVFKTSDGPHRNNVQLGRFGRNRGNVWQYPGVNSFARNTGGGNLLALHPTVKPTALVADAILDCTARGDIVLDGFLGSGTTVIAAERTGRRCFGSELDPAYVDTIIRRWQNLTGEAARHAESGRCFDDHAGEEDVADAA